jgi:hypothetical protein
MHGLPEHFKDTIGITPPGKGQILQILQKDARSGHQNSRDPAPKQNRPEDAMSSGRLCFASQFPARSRRDRPYFFWAATAA